VIDLRAVGLRLVDIGGGQFGVQFAINTWGERSHPNYPAEFDIFIDTNRDGTDDFVIYTGEAVGFGASGQNLVNVVNLTTGLVQAFFYTDADLDSANAILTAPLSALGMTPATQFRFAVVAGDNYFTGAVTDVIAGMTYQLSAPRFVATVTPPVVPVGGTSAVQVAANPAGATASPSQTGLLLLYRDALTGREADIVLVGP
jgi:hypothetical protein